MTSGQQCAMVDATTVEKCVSTQMNSLTRKAGLIALRISVFRSHFKARAATFLAERTVDISTELNLSTPTSQGDEQGGQ